ncbi:MAG: tetratricopeptide repeat protein [Deltaproteobacteria bacterium]|nr:tetratricopeptide repeat protein [Deltaproteobacteria bacterium]
MRILLLKVSGNLPPPVRGLGGLVFILCMLITSPVFCGVTDMVPDAAPGALSPRDPQFDAPVSRGILLAFTDQHEQSLRIFNRLLQAHPKHPAPNFFKRTNRFEKELEQNIQEAIEKGKRILRQKEDPWVCFYVGAAYGYRALQGFRRHDWIGAYLDAGRGVDNFKIALEKEPHLYDAYLGLGSYHYWRTAKSEALRLIAFWIPDKRELGLQQLEFAFEHGRYATHEAGYNLVVAYYDSGRYQKAIETLDRTISRKKTPGLTDLYYRGRLLIKLERWRDAESVFQELLKSLQTRDIPSVGYRVECRYWIAVALVAQNKKAEALELVRSTLKLGEQRNRKRELEGPFESFREINLKLFGIRHRLTQDETELRDDPP